VSEIAFIQNARDNKLTAEIGERHPSRASFESASPRKPLSESSLYRSHHPDKAGVSMLRARCYRPREQVEHLRPRAAPMS
jgi:hypothetical protein